MCVRESGDAGGRRPGPAGRTRRVTLLPAESLPPGRMRRIDVSGVGPLAVYNVDGTFHVTDDTCPHGQVSLTEGDLDGDVVVCPGHFAEFCVRTGEPQTPFPVTGPVTVYPSEVVDGEIVAEIPVARREAGDAWRMS